MKDLEESFKMITAHGIFRYFTYKWLRFNSIIESMINKIKKLLQNTVFNILLILALTILVLYFSLKDNGETVLATLRQADIRILVFLFFLMIFERAMLGWGLALECKQSHPHYTWRQGFVNAYTAGLFNNITPGASGGQIAQGYIFKKQGIPVSHSVGILWLDFIVYQTTMSIFVLFLLIMRFHYFYANYSQFFLIVIFGFMVASGIIAFLWALAKWPKFYTWLTTTGINIGVKLHLVKDKQKTLSHLEQQLESFAKEIVVLQTHKKMIVLLALDNLLRLCILYSVPFICAKALHIPVGWNQLLDVIALSSFVAMVNAFLPMPGSSGGTEATFILMFSTIFGTVNATSIMILWRFVTFYLTLINGGIIFIYARAQKDIPIYEDHLIPRTFKQEAIQEEIEEEMKEGYL